MLQPTDDLFACGVSEPCSSTVCSVIGIDDLIVVGIIAAASIAASQISASENESNANDLLDQKQKIDLQQNDIGYWRNRGQQAANRIAARHGGHGGLSQTEVNQPWAEKLAIQQNYDLQKQANARQADATRTQGYINAGSAVAQGIAGQALKAPSSGSSYEFGGNYGGTGMDAVQRAGTYNLNPQTSGLLSGGAPIATPQIQVSDVPNVNVDPTGGFQLNADHYALLSGQDPNRYRFTL